VCVYVCVLLFRKLVNTTSGSGRQMERAPKKANKRVRVDPSAECRNEVVTIQVNLTCRNCATVMRPEIEDEVQDVFEYSCPACGVHVIKCTRYPYYEYRPMPPRVESPRM
jgi:hypothetical protein